MPYGGSSLLLDAIAAVPSPATPRPHMMHHHPNPNPPIDQSSSLPGSGRPCSCRYAYVRALALAAGHVVRSKHPCVVPGPGVYSDLAAERRRARMQAQLADACMHPSDNTTHTLYVSSKVLKLLQNGLSQRQRNAFWPGSVGLP